MHGRGNSLHSPRRRKLCPRRCLRVSGRVPRLVRRSSRGLLIALCLPETATQSAETRTPSVWTFLEFRREFLKLEERPCSIRIVQILELTPRVSRDSRGADLLARHREASPREQTTTSEGKGAPCFASSKWRRPRTNRISCASGKRSSWNHRVSVRAGTSHTITLAFPEASSCFPFRVHLPISFP